MSTDLNHILRDEELVSQIMAHLDSENTGYRPGTWVTE